MPRNTPLLEFGCDNEEIAVEDENMFHEMRIPHPNFRWRLIQKLVPFLIIIAGFTIMVTVPRDYAYPRDGMPYMFMQSFGEEISGWPVTIRPHGAVVVYNTTIGNEVFDIKTMVPTTSLCDGNQAVNESGVELRIFQGSELVFTRTVPFACERDYLEDVYTFDAQLIEDMNQTVLLSNTFFRMELRVNVTKETAVMFDVMEFGGLLGRHRAMIAAIILVLVYSAILSEVCQRALCTLLGAICSLTFLALLRQAPHMKTAASWISETTLALLFGMMLMLHIISDTGVLESAAVEVARHTNGSPWRLLLALCLGTGFLSMFLPNLAVVSLIVPVTTSLCQISSLDPADYIIMESIFSGIGSAMTMLSNPPNVIIGQAFSREGVNVNTFIDNVGIGCLVTLPFLVVGMRFMFKPIYNSEGVLLDTVSLHQQYPIKDKAVLQASSLILVSVILAMFFSPIPGLDPSWFAFGGGLLLLLLVYPVNIIPIMQRMEWDAFLYLAGLFVLVEACTRLRLIDAMGRSLSSFIALAPQAYTLPVAVIVILWVVTVMSAFLDTIPLCVALVKVIQVVARKLNLPVQPLAWALAFAASLGQNATIVGSANNVVAVTLSEKAGHPITSMRWMKIGIPCVLITQGVITCYMLVRYVEWTG
uniref:Citrate transporter-like domain-containing protein n=1 Tax=Guillardia theta TaxID=55529 RepID=A0A7S4PP47_GUITH|mmetsp:Transcript_753/g.2246  ORF Transcript_753/g.2246 Transcript_753/m.2246 type:complete len:646 (+) Transcript_753:115-2052(+)